MDIKSLQGLLSSPTGEITKKDRKGVLGDGPPSSDQRRIKNENGIVLTGPAFYRGDDEIRDIASFTTESLDALAFSQGEG